ncbi:hypothetical protein [Shewanella xiamenensis]|uniref:Uncharacterized protein n=1 Tax=Shewanella xiamenensis TaxID=332186 RepID=A0AAE4TPS4_9GAMM|nr:hypothetical protein [Shewanella xiamenensis]MDV5392153.1 hypothetical protein [Shewanella xiamenensis]
MTKIQILLNDAAEVVMPALHDFDVKSFSIKNGLSRHPLLNFAM